MQNDLLSSALSKIANAEKTGKKICVIHPGSNVVKGVLEIINKAKYTGSLHEEQTKRGNALTVNLIGTINKCGAIKPRHSVAKEEYEKFEKRFLPAKDFGILVVSTPKGIMTHYEAKKLGIGGKLLAYCY